MDVEHADEGEVAALATLNPKQLQFLSQISQDIRATVSHLSLPEVSPLSVLDTSAIDCLKDLYYALNNEDPLNSMPVRRHILDINLAIECLIPITIATSADPASARNKKQWSLPTYQTLRLLSVLTLPISAESELPAPAQLDYLLLELRFQLALHQKALSAFVSLLQYYIDRKAEKRASFAPAEESKLEDARIDNIFRFFCNILSPPRSGVGDAIFQRDRAVHLALIGTLVKVDFFSTVSVLFSSAEDSRAQYSDLVFVTADIYAQTYRHSSPVQLFQFFNKDKLGVENRSASHNNVEPVSSSGTVQTRSVFDEDDTLSHEPLKEQKSTTSHHTFSLRDALLRERSAIGGSRAALAGSRWTSRHSGDIVKTIKRNGDSIASVSIMRNPNGFSALMKQNILPAKGAIQRSKVFNPMHDFQENVQVNSELLCLYVVHKRVGVVQKAAKKQSLPPVRHDLIEDGLRGLVLMTEEMVDISFQFYIRELRDRILEFRERARADEQDTLKNAERSFLSIVGSVVGFHREKHGKIYKAASDMLGSGDSFPNEVHQNDMRIILGRDFKIVKFAWKQVEAAIELESFQLVFSVLVDACAQLRESGTDDRKSQLIELSTFSVLEMMKMLQGMAAKVAQEIEESDDARQGDLTPREVALNTLEQLFERESFLNAPADLAKMYNTKLFSFRHLRNIVEMTHTFTTILLDEQELAHFTVAVVKRRRKRSRKKVDEDNNDDVFSKDEGNAGSISDVKETEATPLSVKEVDTNSSVDHTTNVGKEGEVGNDVEAKDKDGDGSADEKDTSEGKDAQAPSRVEMMLRADEEARLTSKQNKPKEEANTRVEKMLLADRQADIESAPKPQYVINLDDKNVREGALATQKGDEGDEEDEENQMREVESIGIVRRFAHSKAIGALLLPLRVALCQASELVGKTYPVPEGSEILAVPTIVAKSASTVRAIWNVAQHRERGALCAHFFSFEVMQILRIALSAQTEKLLKPQSVLAYVAELGTEVTKNFFKWLNVHPALIYDLFLTMDRSYTVSLARKVNAYGQESQSSQKKARKKKGDDTAQDQIKEHDSSDEYADDDETGITDTESNTPNHKGGENRGDVEMKKQRPMADDDVDDVDNLDFGPRQENKESGKKRKRRTKSTSSKILKGSRRPRADRSKMEEDEDIEDLDTLRFGRDDSSEDDNENKLEPLPNDNSVREGDSND